MRKPVVCVHGRGWRNRPRAHRALRRRREKPVVTVDVNPLEPALGKMVQREFTGSIMDKPLLERVLSEFEVETGITWRRCFRRGRSSRR